MKRQCLQCQEPLHGRPDQKFCSSHCRSTYHNHRNRAANNYMRTVNSILRRNRQILADLNPNGKTRIHRDRLSEQGFHFGYFTSEYHTRKGNHYRFCYEQGYLELEGGYLALVVRWEYADG